MMGPVLESDLRNGYYVLEWLIRIGALAVVPARRSPAAARGWLLLIFFLPIPGLLLFWFIGSPRFPRWRRERFDRLLPFYEELAVRLNPTPLGARSDEVAALVTKLGKLPAVPGNSIDFIDDYDGAVQSLIRDIDAAKQSVDILVYIFADDDVGRAVAGALRRACGRGVRVRVVFDPIGSHKWLRGTFRLLRDADVEFRAALPFRLWRHRTRRDMRNHRKLFVIDGQIGYAGSQNIVAKDFRPGVVNREMMVRLTGPIVSEMLAVCRVDWSMETGNAPEPVAIAASNSGSCIGQLLPSGPDYPLEGFATLLTWLLHRATQRVIVTTPYFVPDESLIEAMRTAALRGVVVDLIVSAVVDQWLVSFAQRSFYDELLDAGVRIWRYDQFLLHAKNVTVDNDIAIVGSSNVDLRSFQLNEEVSLVFHDEATVGSVREVQLGYLNGSRSLDLQAWRARPVYVRPIEYGVRMFASLL